MLNKKKSFLVKINSREYDYRLGKKIDLKIVNNYFSQKYEVVKIWSNQRHILGILQQKGQKYFLKLATTRGISFVTENEFKWNEFYNNNISTKHSNFLVPINYEKGYLNENLFYLITDKFAGNLIADLSDGNGKKVVLSIEGLLQIIQFSEEIQKISVRKVKDNGDDKKNHRSLFVEKTKLWYEDIPENIREKYNLEKILEKIEQGSFRLCEKPRHGDFAPWHMFRLKNSKLGLIDGEHFQPFGVEYYDIAYFLQRIYSVLKDKKLAARVIGILRKREYDIPKLQTVLYARMIGGFLDESLKKNPDYQIAKEFCDFIINL